MKTKQTKYKETEIGKIPEDWKIDVFSKLVSVNPRRELRKGAKAKKVSMQNILERQRKINEFEMCEYKGGAKFRNKDTLMARITPCLENGKIAFIDILNKGEIAFGSTEFNVLSGKEEVSDDMYVYYLSKSPFVLPEVINSMVGTSGRQRVQNDVFNNILIPFPEIEEQKAIAKILSDLDSKIELNQQINKTLEAIGQALFKRWFVDFEFPDDEVKPYKSSGGEMVDSEFGYIPKGWRIKNIGEVISFEYGKALKEEKRKIGNVPVYGSNGQIGWHNEKLVDGPGIIIGRKGNPGIVTWSNTDFFPIDTTFYVIPKNKISIHYIFFALKNQRLDLISADSAVPGLNRNIAYMNRLMIPKEGVIKKFDIYMKSITKKIQNNNEQNISLISIRDSLLPRLMSGRIRVK